MKFVASSALLFGLLATPGKAKSSRPGQCKTDGDCKRWGGATCVSVKNDKTGVEKASQCVFGDPQNDVCGGKFPGKCPTFSSWPKQYQALQPVCAFFNPGNCYEQGEEVKKNSKKVECFDLTLPSDSDDEDPAETIRGIYACQDRDLYEAKNLGHTKNLTLTQLDDCSGKTKQGNTTVGTDLLCNGQGTCAAVGSLSHKFECRCNSGYSKDDNCFKPSSNACDNFGQCGEAGSCNTKEETCECDNGVSGDQCSGCTGDEGCGGHGNCTVSTDGEAGKCTCEAGYEGDFCTKSLNDDAATTLLLSLLAAMGSFMLLFANIL